MGRCEVRCCQHASIHTSLCTPARQHVSTSACMPGLLCTHCLCHSPPCFRFQLVSERKLAEASANVEEQLGQAGRAVHNVGGLAAAVLPQCYVQLAQPSVQQCARFSSTLYLPPACSHQQWPSTLSWPLSLSPHRTLPAGPARTPHLPPPCNLHFATCSLQALRTSQDPEHISAELDRAVQQYLASTAGPERLPRLAAWLVAQQREIALELSSRQAMAAKQEVLAAQQAAHEQARAAHEAASKLSGVSRPLCR